MIPRLLMHRELGIPGTQSKIEETIQQKVTANIANDRFSFSTINLSTDCYHRTFRNGDFVAVLSMTKIGQRVQRLALWSLPIGRKLWELTIDEKYTGQNPGNAIVSQNGMVVVDSLLNSRCIIVVNGEVSGQIDRPPHFTISLVGYRILGWWIVCHTDNADIQFTPENSYKFFGEWDQTGTLRRSYRLDFTWGAQNHCLNEYYWVRLTGKAKDDQSSLIEVIDRITGKINKAELPFNPDEEEFTSTCIVKNRLFFGKNFKRSEGHESMKFSRDPTIYIFDLMKGRVVEQFCTDEQSGNVKWLVANDTYVVWLNYGGTLQNAVKYREISNKEIRVATTVPHDVKMMPVDLKLMGSLLSLTYAQGDVNFNTGSWYRKVIDLTTRKVVHTVRYKRAPWGECTVSNGHMLITDFFNAQNKMYVESFFNEGSSKEMSEFRI